MGACFQVECEGLKPQEGCDDAEQVRVRELERLESLERFRWSRLRSLYVRLHWELG